VQYCLYGARAYYCQQIGRGWREGRSYSTVMHYTVQYSTVQYCTTRVRETLTLKQLLQDLDLQWACVGRQRQYSARSAPGAMRIPPVPRPPCWGTPSGPVHSGKSPLQTFIITQYCTHAGVCPLAPVHSGEFPSAGMQTTQYCTYGAKCPLQACKQHILYIWAKCPLQACFTIQYTRGKCTAVYRVQCTQLSHRPLHCPKASPALPRMGLGMPQHYPTLLPSSSGCRRTHLRRCTRSKRGAPGESPRVPPQGPGAQHRVSTGHLHTLPASERALPGAKISCLQPFAGEGPQERTG